MRAELQEIYELMLDGAYYTHAVNRLRGLFFSQLMEESQGRLDKIRRGDEISEDVAVYL